MFLQHSHTTHARAQHSHGCFPAERLSGTACPGKPKYLHSHESQSIAEALQASPLSPPRSPRMCEQPQSLPTDVKTDLEAKPLIPKIATSVSPQSQSPWEHGWAEAMHPDSTQVWGPLPAPHELRELPAPPGSPHSLRGSSDQSWQSRTELHTLSRVRHSPLWHLNLLGPSHTVATRAKEEGQGPLSGGILLGAF